MTTDLRNVWRVNVRDRRWVTWKGAMVEDVNVGVRRRIFEGVWKAFV